MIDHVWSVLCTRSVTDRDSNTICLLDVVEQINVVAPVSLPGALAIKLELVSLWTRTDPELPSRGRERIRLLAPDGSQTAQAELELDLTKFQRLRTQAQITGLPLSGSGRYWFAVDLQRENESTWQEVARIPVHVVVEVHAVAQAEESTHA